VSQCTTETLFQDLLKSDQTRSAASLVGAKRTAKELEEYMDNFLKVHGLMMTVNEFYDWRDGADFYRTKNVQIRRKGAGKTDKRD
jgi:hypothetical protein